MYRVSTNEKTLKKASNRSLTILLKSEFNAKNKITLTGILIFPVLKYSLDVIIWRVGEIQKFDGETRKILQIYEVYSPKSCIHRLYRKRKLEEDACLKLKRHRKQS
jgi:hypothetical protein